jgi:ribulose-5-phosphate 4-epimerase/fuculose-1-phosphate aldolase
MASVRDELVRYGNKIYRAHLVIAAGGNISARDEDLIWMKPSVRKEPWLADEKKSLCR